MRGSRVKAIRKELKKAKVSVINPKVMRYAKKVYRSGMYGVDGMQRVLEEAMSGTFARPDFGRVSVPKTQSLFADFLAWKQARKDARKKAYV